MRYRIRSDGDEFDVEVYDQGMWCRTTPSGVVLPETNIRYHWFSSERHAEKWAKKMFGQAAQRDREWRTV